MKTKQENNHELTTFVTKTIDNNSQNDTAPEKQTSITREQNFRLTMSILFVCGSIVIFFVAENRRHSAYHIISYMVALTQLIWLISFLSILLSMKHIHYILIKRKMLSNTALLIIPYAYQEWKSFPMKSISNISALRGSNMYFILCKAMNITFGMVFSAISMKWAERQSNNRTTIALILLLIAGHGGGILTRWELAESKLSICLHQFGALLGFVAGPLAFAIYQEWSLLSVLLMVITWLCLI
eukprot:43928_1